VTATEQPDTHGRGLMGVRGAAGLVVGHLQTVQGAGTVTCANVLAVGPAPAATRTKAAVLLKVD
jgi:hypothetical protein